MKNNIPNYQVSGTQPNYSYKGNQNLNFDSSSISQSGYTNKQLLSKDVSDQQQFVYNYNSYNSDSTFKKSENNSSHLENLRDFSQFNIEKGFASATPILNMLNTKNKNDTLYTNLNENLMKEAIMEVRLNIDSIDRDVRQYPDPFDYVVTFGPIVNSGLSSTIARTNLKEDLKKVGKRNYNKNEFTNDLDIVSPNNSDYQNKNIIIDYNDKLKRIYNPFITRNFQNVKFVRLDNVVLPRFDCLKINYEWDFWKDENFINDKYIKDEYERIKNQIILNYRYIPNDNLSCSLFTDRFIQIYIKEIESNYNLGTNTVSTKSFTVFPDKQVGILYWRGNPYYALKTYKDSLLGNINRLSIKFYNSWGLPITLDTSKILYENNQILNTDIINCDLININDLKSNIKNRNWLIEKINEILKCFITINFNIKKKIPFYNTENINPLDENSSSESDIQSKECYPKYYNIKTNNYDYVIDNIYHELNEFVTIDGFISVQKKNKSTNKKEFININEFINNVIWFNFNNNEHFIYNLECIINNYKIFGFKVLNKLKIEAINIPLNSYFQNNLTFVLGQYTNELNTKIDFEV